MINLKLMYQAPHQWFGVYFHMAAEDVAQKYNCDIHEQGWCAPDLVGSDFKLETLTLGGQEGDGIRPILARTYHLDEGIHDVTVYGEPARLFLWHGSTGARGLVCLLSDGLALLNAQIKFESRLCVI